MARISDAIGYDVEVSEPNGPTVHGYITDRWANSRQPAFELWLAEHDAEVREQAAQKVEVLAGYAEAYLARSALYIAASAIREM